MILFYFTRISGIVCLDSIKIDSSDYFSC